MRRFTFEAIDSFPKEFGKGSAEFTFFNKASIHARNDRPIQAESNSACGRHYILNKKSVVGTFIWEISDRHIYYTHKYTRKRCARMHPFWWCTCAPFNTASLSSEYTDTQFQDVTIFPFLHPQLFWMYRYNLFHGARISLTYAFMRYWEYKFTPFQDTQIYSHHSLGVVMDPFFGA